MSLYELLSTMSALNQIRREEQGAPEVSDEEWEQSMNMIEQLAQFDPSIQLG